MKHFSVEYDLAYYGGDYSGVGQFVYLPLDELKYGEGLSDEQKAVGDLFNEKTGHDPSHIVNYNLDELVDKNGNELEEETYVPAVDPRIEKGEWQKLWKCNNCGSMKDEVKEHILNNEVCPDCGRLGFQSTVGRLVWKRPTPWEELLEFIYFFIPFMFDPPSKVRRIVKAMNKARKGHWEER